jgi:hypothetical protein
MEKQGKEASELQALNRILAAMNKLLTEENDRLQKEVSQLVNENGFMRQQVNIVSLSLFIFIHYYSFFCELIIVMVWLRHAACCCHMVLVVSNVNSYCYLLSCRCRSQLLQVLMVVTLLLLEAPIRDLQRFIFHDIFGACMPRSVRLTI